MTNSDLNRVPRVSAVFFGWRNLARRQSVDALNLVSPFFNLDRMFFHLAGGLLNLDLQGRSGIPGKTDDEQSVRRHLHGFPLEANGSTGIDLSDGHAALGELPFQGERLCRRLQAEKGEEQENKDSLHKMT